MEPVVESVITYSINRQATARNSEEMQEHPRKLKEEKGKKDQSN